MSLTTAIRSTGNILGKLPSVEEIEQELGKLEAAYDDLTEAYIEQRLRLLRLLQAATPSETVERSTDDLSETEKGLVQPKKKRRNTHRGGKPLPGSKQEQLYNWLEANGPARMREILAGTGHKVSCVSANLQYSQGQLYYRPQLGLWDIIR